MNRRSFLAVFGSFTAGGCLQLSGPGEDPTDTATASPAPTSTRSPTETATATETQTATSSDTPTETDTATETDTPTEEETPTEAPEEFDYPPGTSADGLSEVLKNAHQLELASTSATVERTGAGLQIVARVDGDQIVGDPGRFDGTVYLDDREFYLRGSVDRESIFDYRESPMPKFQRTNILGTPVVGALAGGGEWEVTGTSVEDGRRVLEVVATGVANESAIKRTSAVSRRLPGSYTVTDVSGTGQVTESGIVRELVADVTVRAAGGGEVVRSFGVTATDIGETTVGRPGWLSRAKRNAPKFDAALTRSREVIELSLTDGTDLSGGFEFDTYDDDGYYDSSFDGTFAVGDTLYIWKNGPRTASVTTSPPDTGEPASPYVGGTSYDVRVGPITLERLRAVGQ